MFQLQSLYHSNVINYSPFFCKEITGDSRNGSNGRNSFSLGNSEINQ